MEPTVSGILATKKRRPFLRQAIRYFWSQTYPEERLEDIDAPLQAETRTTTSGGNLNVVSYGSLTTQPKGGVHATNYTLRGPGCR